MDTVIPTASFLPTIKCSNCAVEVELSMMGDHVCTTASQIDQVSQPPYKHHNIDGASRIPAQRKGSYATSGRRLRVDSNVANRPFLRQNELTPVSSGNESPMGGHYGRQLSSFTPQRSPMIPDRPPSPEYTNLDCAFPPFPISTLRSATPVQKPMRPASPFENEYVREHAEPYNKSRPASQASNGHSRARSMGTTKSRNRNGIVGSRTDPIPRPSTANGMMKPSLASIAGGPRAAKAEPPPLPTTAFANAALLAAPQPRRAGLIGLKPDSLRVGPSSTGPAPLLPPLSPSRSQTFPLHNEDRMSGNGPNSFIARRPSQPSPILSAERPAHEPDTSSLRSLGEPGPTIRGLAPSHQSTPSLAQPDMPPLRAASRNGIRPLPGNRPFPIRSASRTDIRVDLATSNPPPLPIHNVSTDFDHTNHTSTESASSAASNTSVAQTSSSHSSPPSAKKTLSRLPSKPENEYETRLSDLAPPPRPPPFFGPPESPTDPLFLQGRLSPIPGGRMGRPPFSTASSSSASSRASSRNPPSRELLIRRGTAGGSKGVCRGCEQPIMAGQKSISSKDGRLTGRYHKQCFACHTCHAAFETADFYVHNDHPFCAEHYHALNGSLCSGCGKGIEGQYLEATNTKDKESEKFHPQCLTCSTCRITLQEDYFEWMGKVYCEQDAKRAAGVQSRSPRPSPLPGANAPSSAGPLGRPGLPTGPRAGLRPPGSAQTPGMRNGFLSPLSPNGAARMPPSGGRFPERRTTKLMMMM